MSADFIAAHPEYAQTASLDALRTSDYGRLDVDGQVYLDFTGAGLAGASQVARHAALLQSEVWGNPHSGSPASSRATTALEAARRRVLEWFGGTDHYAVVFTANATGALKLVGEAFPFGPGGRLLLAQDNHNSANGIRELAERHGAVVEYVPLTVPELRLDLGALDRALELVDGTRPSLFVYPAQSNFSGVRHPLALVARARDRGWRVMLDAAAFVPTARLDLRVVQADFVCVSFYKMFGYPTGVGCLLARREALAELQRPWFAGGTVNFATVHGRARLLSPGEAGFEDGTLNYQSIPAVAIGLDHLASARMDAIETRVSALTGWLLTRLVALRHSNGRPMVRIYGPITTQMRGGTVTMNFYDPDGHLLDYRRVEELAGEQGVSLRTGCFCNPGAGEAAEGITDEDVAEALATVSDLTLPRFVQMITLRGGKSAGAIRVSLGLVSNIDDVERYLAFAESLRDQTRLTMGDVRFDIESCRVIRDGS